MIKRIAMTIVDWFSFLCMVALLSLISVAGMVCVARLCAAPIPRYEHPPMTAEEKRYLNSRFEFHGILSCVYDPNTGEHYFERDGKRCRL